MQYVETSWTGTIKFEGRGGTSNAVFESKVDVERTRSYDKVDEGLNTLFADDVEQ